MHQLRKEPLDIKTWQAGEFLLIQQQYPMHSQPWGDFLIKGENTFKLLGVFFWFDKDT